MSTPQGLDDPRVVRKWSSRLLNGFDGPSPEYRLVYTGTSYELQHHANGKWLTPFDRESFSLLAKLIDSELTKAEERRRQFERIMRKRHPCEVTADRLIEHAEKYRVQGDIADAISKVRHWLLDRAEEPEKGGAE